MANVNAHSLIVSPHLKRSFTCDVMGPMLDRQKLTCEYGQRVIVNLIIRLSMIPYYLPHVLEILRKAVARVVGSPWGSRGISKSHE